MGYTMKGGNHMTSDPESKKRWDKENTVMVSIKFQKKTDGDIIGFLQDNAVGEITKQDIIKAALRMYMKEEE
jgi:hypothetical protein